MARPFSHLEPGTDEAVWVSDPRYRSAPELDADVDLLVVVAAHPDDETLGAAGLMRRVHERGGRVRVIVATDGEGSHPDSPTWTPADLARVRRDEVRAAVRGAAPRATVEFLALPDGGLREEADALTRALVETVDAALAEGTDARRVLAVSPWSEDGHRDHRIAAETLGAVCARRRIRHLGYPIWLWHWGVPGDLRWSDVTALTLDEPSRERKQRLVALHVSQVRALSPDPGDEAIVHDGMRAHFERDRELFVVERAPDAVEQVGGDEEPVPLLQDAARSTLPAGFFDAFYARNADDPWGFESRWYEERKRSVLASALPRRHLGRVLEVGCATGLTTADLATRAESVLAMDAAEAALSVARERFARDRVGTADVRFVRGVAPDDWPDGVFDTIVLSEVAYYLSASDLDRLVRRIDGSLADDGCLVACHWRHPVPEYPQSGDAVHETLHAHAGWEATVRHEERDFLLDVFERAPARSVAEREGLR